MATTPQFVATVRTPVASIANGDGTAYKSIMVGGTGGSRLDTVAVTNSDNSNAYVVQVAVQISGVDYEVGEVPIPVGAGTNGSTKSVALLNTTDLPFLAYSDGGTLLLAASAVLRVRSKTAVSGSNLLKFAGVGGDY